MKRYRPGALFLAGLTGAYLVLRYPLFSLHGMKEWPFVLFSVGAAVIILSCITFSRRMVPVLTVFGYIAGFTLGYIFQLDYGPGLNNLWIIWTCIYSAAVLAGAAAGIFYRSRKIN